MMVFFCISVHILGKKLFAADSLSLNPQEVPYKREKLQVDTDAFIQMITSYLSASSRRLEELRAVQMKDETCRKLTYFSSKRMAVKERSRYIMCTILTKSLCKISSRWTRLMRGC